MSRGKCPKCGAIFMTTCGQGEGKFLYGIDNGAIVGIFDILDIFRDTDAKFEDTGSRFREYRKYMASAQLCTVCGYIWGQASKEQMALWMVGPQNKDKYQMGIPLDAPV